VTSSAEKSAYLDFFCSASCKRCWGRGKRSLGMWAKALVGSCGKERWDREKRVFRSSHPRH